MAKDIKLLFGKRVRQLRLALGMSQEAFAHHINIDRSYYGSIERGERNVSLDNISLIAEGLGVLPGTLFQFETLGDDPEQTSPKKTDPNRADRKKGKG